MFSSFLIMEEVLDEVVSNEDLKVNRCSLVTKGNLIKLIQRFPAIRITQQNVIRSLGEASN